MQKDKPQQDVSVSDLWTRHMRANAKNTQSWACTICTDRKIFSTTVSLRQHAMSEHASRLPHEDDAQEKFLKSYESDCALKALISKGDPRKPSLNEDNRSQPDPGGNNSKRPLSTSTPTAPARTLSGLATLNLGTATPGTDDASIKVNAGGDDESPARKRAAIGDGISAGSASPFRDQSASPPPQRSKAKARPNSAPYGSSSNPDIRSSNMGDIQRPQVGNKQLWREQDAPTPRPSFVDPKNIASVQAQKQRAQALQPKSRKSFQTMSSQTTSRSPVAVAQTPSILRNPATSTPAPTVPAKEEYDILRQPETRPISQEQLVAEVKGIYAGLVMVEAKCIEVDNKQASLAQSDPSGQPKLNNEQWQALIALHRTLLHEHHDFFLASQHPSASPALRRLASKYAMPARMWRHGIHSFLELLRHRLPLSLDHMLAFIYLAYSMMALLYETVPAFEDTWIECLGDLGRYRMAIEDDDIRDREVWTGVARHWYSKASDKAPTTGRLYHHLAILARPNALQQLFYYSKSLCVVVPFASARESILTLFEPVLNSDNAQNQYRLPPLDTAFVKSHGLLFTNRDIVKFDPAVDEFLSLLDNQIGRVTRKFMEQGTHIAVSNCVALLGFGSKDNLLMKAIMPTSDEDTQMDSDDEESEAVIFFKHAQRINNDTLKIVLQRIGDPNVLPFLHIIFVFLLNMSKHSDAMSLIESDFPWELLVVMLNTLLASVSPSNRMELEKFPIPEKDDIRPFPEDYALRGLLFSEGYFPKDWFSNEKVDEEEKYYERASMTAQRKERIIWLARKVTRQGSWFSFNGRQFCVGPEAEVLLHSMTFASASSFDGISRTNTWSPVKPEFDSDSEKDEKRSQSPIVAETDNDYNEKQSQPSTTAEAEYDEKRSLLPESTGE